MSKLTGSPLQEPKCVTHFTGCECHEQKLALEIDHYRGVLGAIVERYERCGDIENNERGVSIGIYTICLRALSMGTEPVRKTP